MRGTTSTWRSLWAGVALAAALSACGDDAKSLTASWVYSEAETMGPVPAAQKEALKKQFAGLSISLDFWSDNSYRLVIQGGPAPGESTGKFKSAYGQMILRPSLVGGKAVADPDSAELHLRSPDRAHLEYLFNGVPATLVRRK